MKHRRNTVLWAIGWWLVRREVRRRTAATLADVGAGAARRGRLRSVLGAIVLVGVLAAGFVAVRRFLAGAEAPGQPIASDTAAGPQSSGAAVA